MYQIYIDILLSKKYITDEELKMGWGSLVFYLYSYFKIEQNLSTEL